MNNKILAAIAAVAVLSMGFVVWHHVSHHDRHAQMHHMYQDDDTQAQALVSKAVAAYQEQGRAVFDEMNDVENSDWVMDDDFYVFAFDLDANSMVVHPARPDVLNVNLMDPSITDTRAARIQYIAFLSDRKPEGRWVHYAHLNPLKKKGRQKYQVKRTWVVQTDDNILFGAGHYVGRH